jgi:hypothetical protein
MGGSSLRGRRGFSLLAAKSRRRVCSALPPSTHLDPVWTTPYQVSSPLWRARLKSQIVNWIPHCVRKMSDPKTPEGSIENFVQAARKNAGATDAKHIGPVFSDGWFYNIVESMCLAQMIDAQGD